MQSKQRFKNIPFNSSLLCLSACICQNLYAETDEQAVTAIPPIIAEATRTDTSYMQTPASVYRVDAAKQQNNIDVNLTEVIKGIPSLQINNRENYAQDLQISMRGFGARSTFGVRGLRLYVDGIPATMPDGQGQTSNIDLSSLDHIEVLTGPFSSLYGNSSGGTILTSTKEGQGRDSITMNYAGGSNQRNHVGLVLQGGSNNQYDPAYVVSSSYFDTDGYRDHSAAHKVLNNAKLTWNLDDGSKINWITNYVNISAQDPGGLTRSDWQANPKQVVKNVLDYNARKEIEQIQTGVTWDKPLDDQNDLYAMAYMGQRSVTQYQSIPKISQVTNPLTEKTKPYQAGGVIDFDRQYYGADLRWTGKDLLPNTKLSAGLALDAMTEDRKGFNNFAGDTLGIKGATRRDEDNTLWNIDPYVQASWNFLPTWTLDAGLRYSNVHFKTEDHYIVGLNGDNSGKTNYDKVLPSAALSWQILPELLAYASYAKGFETPTFTEMSYAAVGSDAANAFNLSPASSDTYELGLKSSNRLGDFTLAVFDIKTKNDIVAASSEGGRSTYRNADKTERKGAEFTWNKNLWRDLFAQASYSYLDAKFDADIPADGTVEKIPAGNYIPGIAKNQAYLGLTWKPEQGLYAGVDARYADKIYVNDINSDSAPSYTIFSANLGYAWALKDWKFNTYARVDNLFDKNYIGSVIVNESNKRYFEPAEGRNFSAGVSVTKQF
ncbi:TonB-dependent receptor [Acinetobacter gerneri]|jgi:iron complex outermembrane receptor protein|uniref:TonB-dependent receptor n=1 Tax=Acinetobacter gerneri TaxID=202952 RepID=UPI0023F43A19|nr:TonB-dependent receptor [Acinetobacter gerneri]MCH4243963.1 TonB-dependent receptor [Acinetobacter gerneri]